MKRLLILFLLALGMSTYAQNNIVYVRYDMAQGNASLVVSKISSILEKSEGEFVIYYCNGQIPTIINDNEEWNQLKTEILSQQTSPDYYPEEDFIRLNSLFEEKFKETVSTGSPMNIWGANDSDWTCIFILSEQMLGNDEESDLISRIISISGLVKRMPVKILSYNHDDIEVVRIEDLNQSKLYNYFVD